MALPDNTLSTRAVRTPYIGARALQGSATVDHEDGGIALQDPSRGLMYQIWRARIINDGIVIDAPSVPEFVAYSGTDITEVSLAFDQNMRLTMAFVESGEAKLLWYDSFIGQEVVTTLPADAVTPRVTLDDKRRTQASVSDIILGYKRGNSLYYRQQRDRFQVEYDPTEPMPEPERTETRAAIAQQGGLIKIGMSRGLRLQFMLEVI